MNSGIPFVEQLTGLHFLRTNETAVTKSLGRLTSGLRITTAADDPSGNAIANLHDAQVRGSNMAIHNAQDGISLLRTALSGLLEIEENVLYARDLAVRAFYDSSLTTDQKQRMQDVIKGILNNIDTIANNTTFLGIPILNGGTGTAYTIDTQGQWQAGYTDNPVGSIDTLSSPGDIELAALPWVDNSPGHQSASGVENYVTITVITPVDNGDGTTTATISMETNSLLSWAEYTGSITFGAGTVINGTGGTGITGVAGTTVNFDFVAGPPFGKNTLTIDITAPNKTTWTLDLQEPAGRIVPIYYGDDPVFGGVPPAFSYTGNFYTSINTNGAYYSGAMDMGTAGGTGSISWNSTETVGTSIQMMVQESADGLGGWTDIGYMTQGRSFDYSNRYLRIVAELNTLGIIYGSPAVHDATITKLEPAEVQAGPDNNIYQIVDLAAIDARTAALGIVGLDPVVASYDTAAEMLAGFNNLVNIDILSDMGWFQLASPIANATTPAPGAVPSPKIFTDYTATLLGDGTYNITFRFVCYGRAVSPPDNGTGFIGNISLKDAEGNTVPINFVIPYWLTFGVGPWDSSYTRNGPANAWTDVDFEIRDPGVGMGLTLVFNADPDVRWVMDIETRGVDSDAPSVWPWYDNNYQNIDVWNGLTRIADNYGGGVGSVPVERRLGESNTTGSFETNPVYVGASAVGSLGGVTNDPADPVQYRIEESATGLGGWSTLVDYGGGTSFTTSSGTPYIRVLVQVNGTAASFTDNPYSYTESTSPRVAGFNINVEDLPIINLDYLDYAIERLDQYRRNIATAIAELEREIRSNTYRAFFEGGAADRLRLANLPDEIVKLARADVATKGAAEMLNLTNDRIFENANTLLGNDTSDSGADFLAIDMQSLLSRILPEYAQRFGPKMFIKL